MPEKLHDCVESVLEDDPDKSEAQAWAICRDEIDAESAEIATRASLDIEAEALDALADSDEAWQSVDGGWINSEEGLAVFDGLPTECRKCGGNDRMEGSMVCSECSEEDPDQQTVTVAGLSQEAIEAIDRRYSADVTVVDGEASAAPTDHPSAGE